MVRITYLDPGDDAPKIEWQGITFRAMVPTEVDEKAFEWLVDKARTHPYFRVEDAAAREAPPSFEPDKPVEKPPPKKPAGKPTLTAEQLQQLAQNRARMQAELAARRETSDLEGDRTSDPEP